MSVLVNKDTKVICQGFTGSLAFPPSRRLPMARKWSAGSHRGAAGQPISICRFSTQWPKRLTNRCDSQCRLCAATLCGGRHS